MELHFITKSFTIKLWNIYSALLLLLLTISSCTKEEPKAQTPTVYIKESRGKFELIRNGEPFFMNGAAAHANYLVALKNAGANTARIYDTTNLRTTLDEAQRFGLAAVVDIPLPKFNNAVEYYENPDLFDQVFQNVSRVVVQHREHPALLYWNLGNELYYPYFYKRTKFFEKFNTLIDLVHELDPNHPVSTTTIGANKLRVLSIELMSPQLDFISFNSFGSLSTFSRRLLPITPIWNGPHVITEWGVNGPWEAQLTSWGAPIEETTTKKAEQIVQRYQDYIAPLKNENSLGSFIFYWGQKNEVTPTWYSLFTQSGLKSQGVYELDKIWSERDKMFPGPSLEYLLLNQKGAQESILLLPGEPATAEIYFGDIIPQNYEYAWEIREESWFEFHISRIIPRIEFEQVGNKVHFKAPGEEGPYRLHLTITNNSGYFAAANIPFYVLSPTHEK